MSHQRHHIVTQIRSCRSGAVEKVFHAWLDLPLEPGSTGRGIQGMSQNTQHMTGRRFLRTCSHLQLCHGH